MADPNGISKWDPNMAAETAADAASGDVRWIDGKDLPIEGRAFDDVEHYYDRLPANVSTNVNSGVRNMKHHTAGMQFRFTTDSKTLRFKWRPYDTGRLSMGHMPSTGVSGIDVYRWDAARERWLHVKAFRMPDEAKDEFAFDLPWTPGTPCLVYLPLYNGIREFSLGIDPSASVEPLPPRKGGGKPVVFYGTSITHGACASRPGMAFVNIVGRDLDVPVVNLGFAGCGWMELEMSDHLARIDASCYVLDCLWNMGSVAHGALSGRNVEENYEPFLRNLRAKRPGVPIVMAGQCSVRNGEPTAKEQFVRALHDRLVAEGWDNLVFLPGAGMFADDSEGTVDGCHPNDYGMVALARAYGPAVAEALRTAAARGKVVMDTHPNRIHRVVGISCAPRPDGPLLDDLARAGVGCVEISLPGADYASFPYAECARRARDAGVDIRSFHLPFYLAKEDGPVDPASLDPAVRRRTVELHRRLLGVAADMGARFAVVHACLEPVEDTDRSARLDASRESMAALAEAGAALGVTVCVENLPRSCLGNTAAELLSIVSCDSRLRVCFDVNHLLLDSHAEFLRIAGHLVATLHISDYDFVNERHWLPGEGKIDWVALADGLDAIGYTDAFTYELGFRGNPKSVARSRDLTPADFVRNAREIEDRVPLTVIGDGGLPNLPMWV